MDIDIVYLWVNGNDPKWIAKRDAFIGKPTGKQANCKGRSADNGELKYNLRSIEKYAPWIRNIFIVTDEQVPEWLDCSNPKVHIVDLSEIMPADSLPCFNSALIEHFIYKIPGLSEHFLYANDDMMINQPVTENTFFGEDGLPKVFLYRKPFRKKVLWIREKVLRRKLTLNVQAMHNASLLIDRQYNKYYGGKLHHNIDAYLKNSFELVNAKFKKEVKALRYNRMRSRTDIHRIVYSYVALAEGKGHLNYVSSKHSFRIAIENRDDYKKFEELNPILFCINDSEHANDDDRLFATEFLNKLFPEKSQFEK